MRCIYCRKETSPAAGIAHCFPEAIYPKGPALPGGTVCDKCNHYFGTTLEPHLIRHGYIALALQIIGLPGKNGRKREQLGMFRRTKSGFIEFPISEPTIVRSPVGGSRATINIPRHGDPKFDLDKFRRALHHIAFNFAALNLGSASVLNSEYDPVRRYIRNPKPKERWPFVEGHTDLRRVNLTLYAVERSFENAQFVEFRLCNTLFIVDLKNSGKMLSAQVENGTLFLPDTKREPPIRPSERDGMHAHFRASIKADD